MQNNQYVIDSCSLLMLSEKKEEPSPMFPIVNWKLFVQLFTHFCFQYKPIFQELISLVVSNEQINEGNFLCLAAENIGNIYCNNYCRGNKNDYFFH